MPPRYPIPWNFLPGLIWSVFTGRRRSFSRDARLAVSLLQPPLEVRGREAEHRASARVRAEQGLSWPAWAAAVNEVLAAYHALLWPDVFIIGGGVTENWEHFGPLLKSRAEIVPAHFRNDAGMIGAAMAAATLAEHRSAS